MNWVKKTLNKSSSLRQCKRLSTQLATVERPKYPKILDASPEGKLRHERQLFYDRIQAYPTVEQKLHDITANWSFFERTYLVGACPASYIGAPFYNYVTRTHVIHGLPESLLSPNVDVDELYENIKPHLCLALTKHFSNLWRPIKLGTTTEFLRDKECGSKFVNELFMLICRALAPENEHLVTAAFDPRSRLSSYWFHGGFDFEEKKLNRKNLCFQFRDHPYYTIRVKKPLPLVVPRDDPLCTTAEVIDYNYHPKVLGIPYKRFHIGSVPGFWPGDPVIFPFIQVYTMDRVNHLTDHLEHFDIKKVEEAFGVMSSFAWLNSLSTYHGFTTYNDLTYSFVGNTIVTNGQDWLFYTYQLNTVAFHEDLDNKDSRNLCWFSGKMRLFDTIEDGVVKGLNDDIFKTLIKFFAQKTVDVDERVLTPYLGEDTRTEEEIAATREILRKWYQNSPDGKDYNVEIPLWHNVYKRHKEAPPCPAVRLY